MTGPAVELELHPALAHALDEEPFVADVAARVTRVMADYRIARRQRPPSARGTVSAPRP